MRSKLGLLRRAKYRGQNVSYGIIDGQPKKSNNNKWESGQINESFIVGTRLSRTNDMRRTEECVRLKA